MTAAFVLTVLVAAAGQPNVLLISADTLRADRLGCYGYPGDISPALDEFARQALVFDDCVCEVPLTTPSFGAMLTSQYPRLTGVTRNGMRMPDGVPMLPEIFRTAGYQTMCVQSNWPLKSHICAFNRGFDIYEDSFHKKRWGFMLPERDAADVTDLALKLLNDRDKSKPYFFWVHYSDPHAPYHFHKEFNPSGKKTWLLDAIGRIRAKYESEVAYMDSHIGRLLASVSRENTVIAFMADHGESLYEHAYLGHGRRVYQDNLHVPFILSGPGVNAGRSNASACVLDIAPTLLARAGLAPAQGMLGLDLMKPVPDNRLRFIETYGGAVPRVPGATLFMAERHPMRQGIVAQNWKFIIGGQVRELYNLEKDPAELKNLASQEPERVKEFLGRINSWTERLPQSKGEQAVLSGDDVKALESLGYLK